eukprot:365818-Chlamydomonas_euryale.AAC.2
MASVAAAAPASAPGASSCGAASCITCLTRNPAVSIPPGSCSRGGRKSGQGGVKCGTGRQLWCHDERLHQGRAGPLGGPGAGTQIALQITLQIRLQIRLQITLQTTLQIPFHTTQTFACGACAGCACVDLHAASAQGLCTSELVTALGTQSGPAPSWIRLWGHSQNQLRVG